MRAAGLFVALLLSLAGCAEPATEHPAQLPSPPPGPLTLALELIIDDAVANGIVTVNHQAIVTVTLLDGGKETLIESKTSNGRTAFQVTLEYGDQEVVVTADDGRDVLEERRPAVRLAWAHITLQFNGYPNKEDRTDTVTFNPDQPDAASMYASGQARSLGYNAHDLMEAFAAQTGVMVEYGDYNDGFRSYSVDQIDGAGNPIDAAAPPWWCYTVNDQAGTGITNQAIAPDDGVLWDLGACGTV